jgi:SAM-dependent methyltransferase
MDRESLAKLLTREGLALLDEVQIDNRGDVVKTVSNLRAKGYDAGLVAAVLSQAKLRNRAKAKFGTFADAMLLTEDGLEQASRLQVAALHAGRFRNAGLEHIADLGCGIGTESLAMAAIGLTVTAVELDEVTAACATYNLAAFQNAEVIQADVTDVDLSKFDGLFFDPARRELGTGRGATSRKFDPAQFSPNYDWVLDQAKLKPTGIKLGPGHPHEAIPDGCEAQWVSVNGDLVELGLWFGPLARPGVARSALLIRDGEAVEIKSEKSESTQAPLRELGKYLYEPDNAVVRSHLIAELAADFELGLIAPEIAYLTGDGIVESPWLRGFEVPQEAQGSPSRIRHRCSRNQEARKRCRPRSFTQRTSVKRRESRHPDCYQSGRLSSRTDC